MIYIVTQLPYPDSNRKAMAQYDNGKGLISGTNDVEGNSELTLPELLLSPSEIL
ncbi:hypothetical protein NTGM5_610022 [Candidatus Nitrotoga sp. M5]|nr:hypothetical protein NTGM5_610022 [Candidatus Nitrotoga sp. M5]